MSNYVTEEISLSQVKEKWRDYSYALVYELSRKQFGKTENLTDICWEECVDARFFSDTGEIHCYQTDRGFKAVCVTDGDATDVLVRTYRLKQLEGKKNLLVKHYLAFDEDGQAYIALTRLAGVKERRESDE